MPATMSKSGFYLAAVGAAGFVYLDKGLYWKEIIPADHRYVHPVTGEELFWPLGELREMAASSNAYADSQDGRVPFPDGHKVTAMGNLGYWSRYKVEPGSKGLLWLKGLVEPGDAEIAKMMGGRIRDVSAFIEPETKDSHGKTYRNVITHVCATPVPVVHSENFQPAAALSRDDASEGLRIYVALSKEKSPMSKRMAKLKTALGIKHDEPDGDEKALAALGLDAEDGDEMYAKRVKAMAKAARLDGEDYPQEQTKRLSAERDDAVAKFTALSNEHKAMQGRVLALEFQGLVDGAHLKVRGPLDKSDVEWAREEFSANRPKNAERILALAVEKSNAAPVIGQGGVHEVPHPASGVALEAKKDAVAKGSAMLARVPNTEVEIRPDGLAFRKKGSRDWIEPTV